MEFNLRKVDPSHLRINGRNLEVSEKTTGKVYISNKSYVDKLFNEMGYGNLGVIKILEEYAGKYISEVGSLHDSDIYIDENKDSFVVCSFMALSQLNTLFEELRARGFSEDQSYRLEFDSCHYFDQYLFKSPTVANLYFAVYPSLAYETVRVLSVKMDDSSKVISGVIDEGDFNLKDLNFINDIFVTLLSPIDAAAGINPAQDLSVDEYIELLRIAGYVKKKRGGKCAASEDFSVDMVKVLGPVEDAIDNYNMLTWIQKKITSSGITFGKAYKVFSPMSSVAKFSIWDIREFYTNNAKEKSDIFQLNA